MNLKTAIREYPFFNISVAAAGRSRKERETLSTSPSNDPALYLLQHKPELSEVARLDPLSMLLAANAVQIEGPVASL
jgi:hypothetical protein